MRTRCSSSLGSASRGHGWLGQPATYNAREGDRRIPGSGAAPEIATEIEQSLATAQATAGNRAPIEEPSPAELAVLRGFAAGLSRREIGAELYISLNTVKTHTRELYRKLGTTSQTEAVARAEALGLFEPSESPG